MPCLLHVFRLCFLHMPSCYDGCRFMHHSSFFHILFSPFRQQCSRYDNGADLLYLLPTTTHLTLLHVLYTLTVVHMKFSRCSPEALRYSPLLCEHLFSTSHLSPIVAPCAPLSPFILCLQEAGRCCVRGGEVGVGGGLTHTPSHACGPAYSLAIPSVQVGGVGASYRGVVTITYCHRIDCPLPLGLLHIPPHWICFANSAA